MKWTDLQPGFCESSVNGPPEYVNAITSLAMTFYGLMGLFMTRNHNIVIRITSAMLAVTGIGSVIYHWTLHKGWGEIDALPMLMSSYLGAYQAFDSVIYKKLFLDRVMKAIEAQEDISKESDRGRYVYGQLSGVLALIFMALLAVSLALSVTEDTAQYFSILFAIPEILIALAVILIRFVSHKDLKDLEQHELVGENPVGTTREDAERAFRFMYFGFGSAIVAAIFWFTTESLCERPELYWLRFLFAHGVWHIAISAGMYFLMQFLVFIYSFNVGKEPYFIKGEKWYEKVFFTLVPTVRLRKQDPTRGKPSLSLRSLSEV